MIKYTIYCTHEQAYKAFELGAPLDRAFYTEEDFVDEEYIEVRNDKYYIPTTDQMIGWLEAQGVFISIVYDPNENTCANCVETKTYNLLNNVYSSRKEATLAAIDSSLKYLSNTKVTEYTLSDIANNILRDILHFEQHHEKSKGVTQYIRNKYEKFL